MPAIHLDASLPHKYWGGIHAESLDLVVNINMIHISPMACTEVGADCWRCPPPPQKTQNLVDEN